MSTGLDPEGGSAGRAVGDRRDAKDHVSAMCRALDEQVQAFRNRPLEGAYPYLWLDAKRRQEAPLGRAGCETPLRAGCEDPAAGLSHQSGEAEGSLTLELRESGGSSPDNDAPCGSRSG